MPGSKTASSFFGALTPEPRPFTDLVNGLFTDGLFSKLDRLWIFARPTETLALTDIIVGAKATNQNSTTFTPNRGYTGDGISMTIDSNFDASAAPTPRFVQNSACLFAWNNTLGQAVWPLVGVTNTTVNDIYPDHGGDCYFGVNSSALEGPFPSSGSVGLYLANRTGAAAQTIDINGVQFASGVSASTPPDSTDFFALHGGAVFTVRQISCMGFGGSLSATDRININTRIRNYMAAVGVI